MFYVFFAIAYWILPLAEMLIYRMLWQIRWRALPVTPGEQFAWDGISGTRPFHEFAKSTTVGVY